MLAALLAAGTPRWGGKVAWWAAAVVAACLVALSRLYLGASWLADVLGGLALGAAWLTGLLTLTRTVPALRGGGPRPRLKDANLLNCPPMTCRRVTSPRFRALLASGTR